MYDVAVIGGGPSGLKTAGNLAEAGLDVVLLERKGEVGEDVICSGIVGEEAFNEFDLSADFILTEIDRVRIVSPCGSVLTYRHPGTFAYVVARDRFDRYLAGLAETRGAAIKLDRRVVDISVGKRFVEVLAETGEKKARKYRARCAVIATGVDFNLNKKLGLGHPKNFLIGVQADLNPAGVDCTTVFVGKSVAPGAFAWAVPLGRDSVRVGLMTARDPESYFNRFMEKFYPEQLPVLNKSRVRIKPIAQGLVSGSYRDRVLVVGEAAGQVKTTTGGGIYFGLLCSEIASEVILDGFRRGDLTSRSLARYEKLWKKRLQREILIGYYARNNYGKLNDIQIEKLFQIARSDGLIPLIQNKGNFDWQSELIISLIKRISLFSNLALNQESFGKGGSRRAPRLNPVSLSRSPSAPTTRSHRGFPGASPWGGRGSRVP